MQNVSALAIFVAAADLRSFTAAGRHLGISASAVGKAIARLEDETKVRLFHRSTRTISLTPEGTLLLERARRILCELEAAKIELSQAHDAPSGTLRVSLPMANALMIPALNGFMSAYPDVRLDLEFGDQISDVIEEGFDAVIRAGELGDSRLMSKVLGEFHLKLVASPEYLRWKGTPKRPGDLRDHDCLVHRFVTNRKFERWPLKSGEPDFGRSYTPAMVANTIEPLIMLAQAGAGIACLPDLLIRDQLNEGRLLTVLDDYVEHAGIFRILWPSSRHLSPKLRAFVDFMSANLMPVPIAS